MLTGTESTEDEDDEDDGGVEERTVLSPVCSGQISFYYINIWEPR
jgi:hypothetical protein